MPPGSPSPSLTPMLRHYLEVKAQHPDALLFYRMGDFYELFYEDAQRAAPILEVTLTARQRGTENEAPMCGVPHHALEAYLGKAVRAGLKVAVCDQMEDPATAKGLVKREVTRVITPGTLSEPGLLDGKEENLLASVRWRGSASGRDEGGSASVASADPAATEHGDGAIAFLDVSTGAFWVRRFAGPQQAVDDLELQRPRELLLTDESDGVTTPAALRRWAQRASVCVSVLAAESAPSPRQAAELLARQLGVATLKGLGLDDEEPALLAAAAALVYARDTQKSDLAHVRALQVRAAGDALLLDPTTLANLEVLRGLREGGRRGTLLSVLDRTVTPAGGRLLKEWLRRPLREVEAIRDRHQAVAELMAEPARRERLREALGALGDPERLVGRAVLGSLTPREAAALRDGLARVPAALAELAVCASPLLRELAAVDAVPDLQQDLQRSLVPSPPASLKDGGVMADGLDPELDAARSLARDSKRHILALEARERQRSGIPSLKIRYNRVFGYYLEVTRANQHLVPADYIRRQTLANAERYVTPEVKELEEAILGAEERQLALEEEHFRGLVEEIAARAAPVRALAMALAAADVLATFAEVAARQRYVRPRMTAAGEPIVLRDSRHPVVEALTGEPFVPNDLELDAERAQIVVLTGPNMGGKSTFLRQAALVVLMAQAGSFVPAAEAEIGVVDRIFTRVGASDDLARGESTFMVEMIETARILHQATAHSLVVLDEVGRGTATFDGLSLAWAIVEHLHERCGAKTLFATHYHELTELAALLPRVVNRTMAVKEWEERIVFLRRVVHGSADKSYGLHVARLAGLPREVVARAAEILANLESQEYDLAGRPRLAKRRASARAAAESDTADATPSPPAPPAQLQLFGAAEEAVARALRDADLDRMTPIQALNLLHELRDRLR